MRTIAIDVGITGAIAVLDTNYSIVYDMPTKIVKDKTVIDGTKVAELLRTNIRGADHLRVIIEAVHSMPQQGVASTFSFGVSYGLLQGICAALDVEPMLVPPQRWKSVYANLIGSDDGKSRARELAIEYFPNLKYMLERKKDHGRADALLLAKYAQMEGL